MNIGVIGAGYVGLVTAACLSRIGHTVVCVEKNEARLSLLKLGVCPIYEPGLAEIIKESLGNGRLSFTSDISDAAIQAEAAFVAVGTPPLEDGSPDISQVLECVEEIARVARFGTVVVTKSTVPVGTNRIIQALLDKKRPCAGLMVGSNPEFLREGSAVMDFDQPERIIIGSFTEKAAVVLQSIYQWFADRGFPLIYTTCENAEIIKYASNAFLALKVGFSNELADLCEALNGDMTLVAAGLGLDSRIGAKFLNPGPGYGGSCLPKDTLALAHIGKKMGARQLLVEQAIMSNEQRKVRVADRILTVLKKAGGGNTVCIWGVAFKANTDDVRHAPALTIIPLLERAGLLVQAHDPVASENAKKELPATKFMGTPLEAAEGADIVVVLTEWPDYKRVSAPELARSVRQKIVIDYRNLLDSSVMLAAGFEYMAVGSSPTMVNSFHDPLVSLALEDVISTIPGCLN